MPGLDPKELRDTISDVSDKTGEITKRMAHAATSVEKYNRQLDLSHKVLSSITTELIDQIEKNSEIYSVAKGMIPVLSQEVGVLRQKFDTQRRTFELSSAEAKRLEDALAIEKESARLMMEERMAIRTKLGDSYQLSKLSAEEKKRLEERSAVLDEHVSAMHEANSQIERQLIAKKQIADRDKAELTSAHQLLDAKRNELDLAQQMAAEAKKNRNAAAIKLFEEGIYGSVSGSRELVGVFKNLAAGPLTAFVQLITLAFERFVKIDRAAEDFRRTTGLTIQQTRELRKNAEQLNARYQDMGVSIEEAYKATEALVNAFGGLAIASESSTETTALLSANLGVAAENTAEVLAQFQGLGGLTEKSANNMVKMGSALTKGTPVSFAKAMEDIAKSSDDVHFLLGSNPKVLMKSAIAARALGTSINAIAAMSKKLLDFQSSINNEMEASALLGAAVNFQRARQLAFEGKIADAAKESLRVVKQAGDWNKMSVFQREALAKASGMELKDLNKMVALDRIRASSSKEGEKLRLLDAQLKTMDSMNESAEARLVTEAESEIKQRQMQSVMTNLGNMMQSIFLEIADVLTPVVKVLMMVIVPVLKVIGLLVKSIGTVLSPIGAAFDKMSDSGFSIMKWLDTASGWLDGIKKTLSSSNKELSGWIVAGKAFLAVVVATGAAYVALAAKRKLAAAAGGDGIIGKIGKSISGKAGDLVGKTMGGLGDGIGKLSKSVGTGIGGLLQGLAKGISALGNPKVLLGVLAMAGMAGAVWILAKALQEFAAVDWSVMGKAAVALVGIAVAAAILGIPAVAALVGLGALVIAGLGLALIPFAAAAFIAGKASQELAKGLTLAITPIKDLADLGVAKLVGAAVGIYAVSAALAAFGAGSALSGMGALVGKLTGGDPIKKLKELASIGDDLTKTANAIQNITSAFSGFGMVDKFSKSISQLSDSMDKLNKSVSSISLLSMAKLTAAAAMSPRKAESIEVPTSAGNSIGSSEKASDGRNYGEAAEKKLQELIDLLRNGAIAVNLDGRRVSSALTNVGR